MAGLTQTEVVAAASYLLKDTAFAIWAATDLQNILKNVVRKLSELEPKRRKSALALLNYTHNVDISGLTGLVKILKVEYPPDEQPPCRRNFSLSDDDSNLLILGIDDERTSTLTTLTGTITFTKDSRTITGSGTLFSSEISSGQFIRVSTGSKFYRVVYVTSDTALTLETPFWETTITDTINLSVKADSEDVCYVYWGSSYTIAASASDIPAKFDDILVTGLVALALNSDAIDKIPQVTVAEGVVTNYRAMADRYMLDYREKLASVGRIEDDMEAIYSRS